MFTKKNFSLAVSGRFFRTVRVSNKINLSSFVVNFVWRQLCGSEQVQLTRALEEMHTNVFFNIHIQHSISIEIDARLASLFARTQLDRNRVRRIRSWSVIFALLARNRQCCYEVASTKEFPLRPRGFSPRGKRCGVCVLSWEMRVVCPTLNCYRPIHTYRTSFYRMARLAHEKCPNRHLTRATRGCLTFETVIINAWVAEYSESGVCDG